MLKVGLTGSIAVGKTYVCDVFEELGCFVLDADIAAREVVEPNTRGLSLIVENFGKGILQDNGKLDREKLSKIVFADKEKLKLLNSIVHPLIIEVQNRWLDERKNINPNGTAIIEAALLIETESYKRFDKLIVVWCNFAIQLKRLMARDNLSEREALKRINAQMLQDKKKSYADFLIDTTRGFQETRQHTKRVFIRLKEEVNFEKA